MLRTGPAIAIATLWLLVWAGIGAATVSQPDLAQAPAGPNAFIDVLADGSDDGDTSTASESDDRDDIALACAARTVRCCPRPPHCQPRSAIPPTEILALLPGERAPPAL
jgi:hypothetical protein